jgi:putative transposase
MPSSTAGGGAPVRSSRISDRRVSHWRIRPDASLPFDDGRPGPVEPLHGFLGWERDAILELSWVEVGRSHRELAHRGSRSEKVFVSESSVLRVLRAENLVPPSAASREPVGAKKPWPDCVEYLPCQVWGHEFSAFMAARRDALGVLDLVSRKWIATLLVVHGRGESEHVQAIYSRALDAKGLLAGIEALDGRPQQRRQAAGAARRVRQRPANDLRDHPRVHGPARPGGPHRPVRHPDRPGPHREPSSDTSRPTGPTSNRSGIRRCSPPSSTGSGTSPTPSRLHAGIGYVTPDDEHEGGGDAIRKVRREGMTRTRAQRIAYRRQSPNS